jgi:putative ABC transport system permease protein
LEVSATVSTRDEATAVRVLYEDIENDQQFWNALAGLVLFAAALAAFNLVSRIVESQRREIGIGMALGVPRRVLAIRPMLVGIQVALLGVIAGVGVGLLVGAAMGNVLESFLPLPVQQTPFQFGVFAQAAALGLVIPLLASAIPTLRAVRVEPIEAIRTGHLTAKTSRLTDWTGRLRLPGSSLVQMPLRNVLRTPRRTVLTAVGVGAAITALVAVLGMLDSFGRTIDQVSDELTQGDGTRVMVQLDTFYPAESGPVAEVPALAAVGATDAGLRLPATGLAVDDADDLELLVELVDFDRSRWAPTIVIDNGGEGSEGVVLAAKAATDLGVEPGDVITLRHPVQSSPGVFELTESSVEVSGIHANPMRAFAFMDISEDERFGLDGTVNFLHAYPSADTSRSDLQRALFGLPGVTSSQSVARVGESFDEALDQFVGVLVIAGLAVLALALLIAFNAVRITVDERSREHATMRAFGLPVRTVMGVVVKESVIVGVLATIIGTVAGFVFLDWMLQSLASRTLPDLRIESYLSPATLLLAVGVGVVAVALAPLFLIRRLTKMSIPDTLRVME